MPTEAFTPVVGDLAQFMRARTKTRYGATVGTFDESTPVTDVQAQGLIQEAVDEVAIAVGSTLPPGPDEADPDLYNRGARALVLLLASMNVELTLSPEQVNDPRSPYAALERRFDSLKKTLVEAVSEARGGESVGGAGGGSDVAAGVTASGYPAASFPPPSDTGSRRF